MRRYLTHVRIDGFGSVSNAVFGPFEPGLNVVFGRNEAGKTTLAQLVKGVLFGWEDPSSRRNDYLPASAERSGALVFARRPEGCEPVADAEAGAATGTSFGAGEQPETTVLYRGGADGRLEGDEGVVADIDRETFRTMFFLTSDELRSLRTTTDMTAKLLTAGAGSAASPARILAELEDGIAQLAVPESGGRRSLARLAVEQEALRGRIVDAEREAEGFRRQERELAELEPSCAEMSARIVAANDEIESLTAVRASVAECDDDIASLDRRLASLTAEAGALPEGPIATGPLAGLSAADERSLRDRIDVLAERLERLRHKVDVAKDNHDASRATYEAYLEAETAEGREASRARQRGIQLALSVALPIVFVAAGVALLYAQGRIHANVSTAILGIALVLFAIILAGASFFLAFRPNRDGKDADEHKTDLHWAMLQDKKRYEAQCADLASFKAEVRAELDASGLVQAEGSLRRARQLLDEAAEERAEETALAQRRQAAASRIASIEAQIETARSQRAKLCRDAGLAEDVLVADIDRAIDRRSRQRAELLEASEGINQRCGELRNSLSHARNLRGFDKLKLAYQQSRTRQREAERDLARLLIAKRMLEASVASWESTSQPEVYRQAGRLLGLMTGGKWTQVSIGPEGELEVADGVRPPLDPARLSLSTCQQLYLSLRIALLVTADNVGRSVPVIADDILVNFDAARRVSAAAALAELSTYRQVVLLTCHEEVVAALQAADPSANVVRI